jgi:hypothetical protein
MRLGLYIRPFDKLAIPAPRAAVRGRPRRPVGTELRLGSAALARTGAALGDPQITLGAIAGATDRIRLGPMVTPLARRRAANRQRARSGPRHAGAALTAADVAQRESPPAHATR